MLIMKDTLKQLGHNFTETKQDVLEIQASYMPICINGVTGMIDYDDAHTKTVDRIKQQYMANFYRAQAIKEGMQVKQEVHNGEIILRLSH
jgi:predicted Ser/Thr protein kinase